MKQYAILYALTLVIMLAFDGLWLGLVARGFYKSRLGDMLEFHLVPALIFYVMYAAGIVYFISGGATDKVTVLMNGAFFGLLAYATYDLTNLATLKGWPLSVALVDMAWGVFNTSVSATAAWWVSKHI